MDIQPITTQDTVTADRRWLMSLYGSETNKTITLDTTTFTETTHWLPTNRHVNQRVLKSGLPLGKITASGLYGIYDSAASDGREVFAGLLETETAYNPTSTKVGAALRIIGDVDASKLPVAFTPPAAANRTDSIHFSNLA
jgi:hypothetical protein